MLHPIHYDPFTLVERPTGRPDIDRVALAALLNAYPTPLQWRVMLFAAEFPGMSRRELARRLHYAADGRWSVRGVENALTRLHRAGALDRTPSPDGTMRYSVSKKVTA